MNLRQLLSLTLIAGLTSSLTAQITYVDAVAGGNTTLADGSAFVPNPANVGNDDNWSDRAFANGGTIYSSNDVNATGFEDAPMLRTTIAGLSPGLEYLVYTYIWGASGTGVTWRGRTLVSSTQPQPELPGYNTNHFASSSFAPTTGLGFDAPVGPQPHLLLNYDASGFETDGHFAGQVMIQEGNRWLYEIPLGTYAADQNGEIDVYFDDLANNSSSNRTWFDGVGYEIAPMRFGAGCGPTLPVISYEGSPLVNTDFTIGLQSSSASVPCLLAIGFSNTNWSGNALPFDLGFIGFPGCPLNVSLDVSVATATDAVGQASMTFAFTGVQGATLYWQWIVLPTVTSMEVTQGLETRFHR